MSTLFSTHAVMAVAEPDIAVKESIHILSHVGGNTLIHLELSESTTS